VHRTLRKVYPQIVGGLAAAAEAEAAEAEAAAGAGRLFPPAH
jgi:hypothetical protein